MKHGGDSLRSFLINLPSFHNRVMILYPDLQPPEFKVTDIAENSIHVHYYSSRDGLQEFVRGLFSGLGKMYATPVNIELLDSRSAGNDHEIYLVSW